jgi:hypothetical protein
MWIYNEKDMWRGTARDMEMEKEYGGQEELVEGMQMIKYIVCVHEYVIMKTILLCN